MLKKIFSLLSVIAIIIPTVFAQEVAPCGTVSPEWREAITQRLLENKRMVAEGLVQERNAITYIPIKFHLVAKADGSGRIPEANVYDMLCRMNEDYADQEIQFFVHDGFNYIDHDNAYTGPGSFLGGLKLRSEKQNGNVNIFICQNANNNGGGQGTTLGYYDPIEDWVILRKQEVTYGSATVSHELGHFFSLLHVHNGWDNEDYDPNVHGNPVPNLAPGPSFTTGLPIQTEREARTGTCANCETAGDYLCDTPPDYNFGFGWQNCDYNAGTMDFCGEIVDPMEINFMGYFLQCTDYIFTTQQKQMVAADIQMRYQQQTLNQNFTPTNTQVLSGPTELQIPEDGELLAFKNVYFDWSPVDGVDGYIFEIDQFNSFSVLKETYFITDGTSKFELDLLPNKDYYWKVTPYNQYSSCVGTTPVFRFKTGTEVSTTEIESVSTWSISPNPASGDNVTLMLDTNDSFTANIHIHNLAGQLIKEIQNQKFIIGNNNINLSVGDIENGTYLVSVQSENGIINNKVVIAR